MTEQELREKIAYELWAEMISPRPSLGDYRVRTGIDYQKAGRKFAKYLLAIVKEAGWKSPEEVKAIYQSLTGNFTA